jgi:hypothetical protein
VCNVSLGYALCIFVPRVMCGLPKHAAASQFLHYCCCRNQLPLPLPHAVLIFAALTGRTLMSAETSTVDLSKEGGAAAEDAAQEDANKEGSTAAKAGKPLSESEAQDFCQWLQVTLGSKKVSEVKVTKRLSDSPAIVTDHESGALRRMMKMVVSSNEPLCATCISTAVLCYGWVVAGCPAVGHDPVQHWCYLIHRRKPSLFTHLMSSQEQANAGAKGEDLPPQVMEVNPSHPLIIGLHALKDNPNSVAPLVAAQLLDNCLMAAGLVEDPRYMIPRLNDLLLATTLHHKQELEYDQQAKAEEQK